MWQQYPTLSSALSIVQLWSLTRYI